MWTVNKEKPANRWRWRTWDAGYSRWGAIACLKGKREKMVTYPLSNHKSSEENSFEFGVTCTKEKRHLISHGQHCWGYAFCVYLVKTVELVTVSGKEALLEQPACPLFSQIETVEYSRWSCLTNITTTRVQQQENMGGTWEWESE